MSKLGGLNIIGVFFPITSWNPTKMRGKGIKNYTHSQNPGAFERCQQLLESEKQKWEVA